MEKKLLCIAISLACLPAYAENVFTLGQIEVIGEKSSDLSTARIDQAELQKNNQDRVSDVAKSTPGVFVEHGGARNEYNLLVRGFNARRVPVFMDGIPVYVPYDGEMDLGRFTTFDLSRIDISKGASSVLYGANTMGGAVNLISKKPTQPFEGSIGYGFSHGKSGGTATNKTDFNLGTKQELFYAQISGSFVEKQGLQLSHHYQQINPKGDDGGRAENSTQRDKKLSLKVAYTPNEHDEYALAFSTQKGTKESPFYSGSDSFERYWRWPMWDKDSIYFLSHTEFGAHNLTLNTKAFYDTFKNDLRAFDDATFSTQKKKSSFNSYYRDYSYGAGFDLGGDLTSKDRLKFSTLIKYDVHREHNDDEPTAVDKDRTYSFGLENTHRFNEQTSLITGISYDKRDASRAEKFEKQCVSTHQKNAICPFDIGNKHAFNYQIKLAHHFSEHDEFALSFAKKTRFATMKERYSRRFGRTEPNPFLSPETAYHYEASYMHTFGDWLRVDSALFYSEVKDAIEEVAISKKLNQYQNVGKEAFKGAELAVNLFATDNLTLGANYTYTHAKNKTQDTIVKNVPKHKFFAFVDWKILPNLSLYVSQEAEHGRYYLDGGETVKLSGFGNSNAKLIYEPVSGLSVEAGVSNLFDKNYAYQAGYPEEGRVYFGNIRYKF